MRRDIGALAPSGIRSVSLFVFIHILVYIFLLAHHLSLSVPKIGLIKRWSKFPKTFCPKYLTDPFFVVQWYCPQHLRLEPWRRRLPSYSVGDLFIFNELYLIQILLRAFIANKNLHIVPVVRGRVFVHCDHALFCVFIDISYLRIRSYIGAFIISLDKIQKYTIVERDSVKPPTRE